MTLCTNLDNNPSALHNFKQTMERDLNEDYTSCPPFNLLTSNAPDSQFADKCIHLMFIYFKSLVHNHMLIHVYFRGMEK